MNFSRPIQILILVLGLVPVSLIVAENLRAQTPKSAYIVETIETPPGVAAEISALTFAADGKLYAAFRRGSIWSYEPDSKTWARFAKGLFFPLGILPGKKGEFFVGQIPELTRVVDTDDDGRADLFETICDDWGLSGNYHEFVAGPVRDSEGNFYMALGCASSGGPGRPPFRGALTDRPRSGKNYGHHSPVPYRGWIVRISPDGNLTPLAGGSRQPNGLGWNLNGDLFSVDNQGDWIGTSPLNHVTRGAFFGHPAGLVWDPRFTADPQDLTPADIHAMRKPPAVQFPQNDLAGSITQPLCDTTDGKFGPYSGQFIVAEWSHPRLLRTSLERVRGEYQGACYLLLEGNSLRKANQRMTFAPDGSLWIGQVSRLWGGTDEGLQRVSWTGETPMDIQTMSLTRTGFRLTFTLPVDSKGAKTIANYSLRRYRYESSSRYGSPKMQEQPVKIRSLTLSPDARHVDLEISDLKTGYIYDLRPRDIQSTSGNPIITKLAAYTLNRLRK